MSYMKPKMSSSRPYVLRAFNDWIVDNGLTPHIVVDADHPRAEIPRNYVQDGKIVLNIAPQAVKDLVIDNKTVQFDARFRGIVHHIYVPISAIEVIYAQENDNGMMLTDFPMSADADLEDDDSGSPPPSGGGKSSSGSGGGKKGGRSHLRVIK